MTERITEQELEDWQKHYVLLSDCEAWIICRLVAEMRALREPKMFPLRTSRTAEPGPRKIPWSVAEVAYSTYSARYGKQQSLERLAERGGFSLAEMDDFHPGWREEASEIVQLQATIEQQRQEIERLKDLLSGREPFCYHTTDPDYYKPGKP